MIPIGQKRRSVSTQEILAILVATDLDLIAVGIQEIH